MSMERRPESGLMRFGEDWTGVFLRGDHAVPMAMILGAVLDKVVRGEKPPPVDLLVLRQFCKQLSASNEAEHTEDFQHLLPFEECLMTRATVLCPPPV